jgi:hypothetical protein
MQLATAADKHVEDSLNKRTVLTVLSVMKLSCVKFEFLTAVTMKIAVFWDVAPCRSCVNRRFGGSYHLHFMVEKSASEE